MEWGEKLSDKVYVGSRCSSLEVGQPYKPVSRVTFHVDDDHFYTAGDDTGLHMEYEMPWATQAMVDDVYQKLKGFVYKPFKATDCMIDPAAEPGDMVTVGGEYFMIAQMETTFDAKCASTISAPSGGEMDHEYPCPDPVERELKRRVKLGQAYQGVKITRAAGLTIVEVQEDGKEGAKVVLNSKELSFYDAGGGRVLYFDPTSGTYKFMGELNVNDKFVVDKKGDVTVKGNLLLSEESTITWGTKGPVKYKFAPAMTGPWHDTMNENDKYRRDSLDGGTTWGDPYQFKGTDGQNGANGSDATVPKYITETVIGKGIIEAPQINANDFAIYPNNPNDTTGSFKIFGMFGGTPHEMFSLEYQDGVSTPRIIVRGVSINVMETSVYFGGAVQFGGGTTGATFTLA